MKSSAGRIKLLQHSEECRSDAKIIRFLLDRASHSFELVVKKRQLVRSASNFGAPPDGCFFAGFSSSLPHTHNRFVLPTRH